jgi:hypothetical protein
LERPVLHVILHRNIVEFSTNQTFCVENWIGSIHCHLAFGAISYQTFGIGKCNITWCGPVPLIISYYFYFSILEHPYTWISCSLYILVYNLYRFV